MLMNSLKVKRLNVLLCQLRNSGNTKLRNMIYELCRRELIQCIKQTTKKALTDCEVLSLSWDAFLLSVEHYSPEEEFQITITKAVRTVLNRVYTENTKRRTREKNVGYNEYPEESVMVDSLALRDSLMALKEFKDGLPKNYQIILEDCIASFGSAKQSKQSRIKEARLPIHRYYEAKKVMSWAVEHILGRGLSNDKSKSTRQ